MANATLKIDVAAPRVYLRVASHGDSFRRAGFLFTKSPQVIACSPEQAKLIWAENGKQLKVDPARQSEIEGIVKSDAELLDEAAEANASLGAKLDAALAEIEELKKAKSPKGLEAQIAKLSAERDELAAKLKKAEAERDELLAAPAAPAQAK